MEPGANNNNTRVERATYPIPHPVACLLQVAIFGYPQQYGGSSLVRQTLPAVIAATANGGPTTTSSEVPTAEAHLSLQVESLEQALSALLENSVDALDRLYFSTPPERRNLPSFSRRLQLRIATDPQRRTLTLTDLGVGMTRADLINALGIGRTSLAARRWYQHHASSIPQQHLSDSNDVDQLMQQPDQQDDDVRKKGDEQANDPQRLDEQQDDGDNDDVKSYNESSVNNTPATSDDDYEFEDEEVDDATEDEEDGNGDPNEKVTEGGGGHGDTVPCKASDLGGFYAALAALGVGVHVGSKAKDDDYYEFSVGLTDELLTAGKQPFAIALNDDKRRSLREFRILRPFPEGTRLNDCWGDLDRTQQFVQVRGESGTRVTLYLNDHAIEAGLLDETIVQPLVTKILESKTQYSVVFSHAADEALWMTIDEDEDNKNSDETEIAIESMDNATIDWSERETNNDTSVGAKSYNSVKERAKYIPLRLSLGERKMLRLVEAAMTCCEYTTSVDKAFASAARRTHAQLKGVTSILLGLVTSCDFAAGQVLSQGDEQYSDYQVFFRQMFEIARRHKIMNPEKMRTEYGKLIYLLQDAVSPSVMPHLGFSVIGPIETVYKFLEERHGLDVLSDKLIEVATEEILAEKKKRSVIQTEIKRKERAVAMLKQKYRTSRLSAEDIHLCLYSICDNNSFLNSNRVPVDKVIDFLQAHFLPDEIEEGYSLSIVSGIEGSRLSHNHERQYYFVLQSLTLWRDIIDDMFRLWAMAEEDLLSESITYSLQDTGQGMQRVQQSPRTYKAMQQILLRVQAKVKHWVGSSVIHMGDHNVPNALSFIDKYTQVPRILGPIVSCLENLERICADNAGIKEMVETGFGGVEKLRKDILFDFFKSAFDGSGGDTFYDAGSCIDGRLTSAWNWCSQLPDKPFFPIFKLTGFTGFDGEFKAD